MKKLDVPQSGSQADTVASRNRFGQYNRTRAMPTQPRTARQVAVRGYLTDASQAWRALTDAQRASWRAYALTTPKTDSLGQTIYPTGHQAFVALWVALTNVGLATPPDVPSDPPASPPIGEITALDDTPTMTLTVDVAPTVLVPLVLSASEQVSQGVNYMGDYRFIRSFASQPVGGLNPLAEYQTKFGALIAGRRIFFRAFYVSAAGGISAPWEINGVVQPGV